MNGFRHLMLRTTSDRIRSLVLCVALSACVVGHFDPAVAQTTPPPLVPPVVSPLPSGSGSLSLGQWLLTPTLGLYGLYDTNIHSNVTAPLSGPGFHIHPSLLADFNTGIFDTSLYGNIDSVIYPTLDSSNDTFDRQAGFIQKYSPLPDLVFSAQGDYTHATNANVIVNSTTPSVSSSSTPITSPASPALPGAAGVTASQQTVVDPNDTYTGTFSVYKEFNRAFMKLGASIAETNYEMAPTIQNYGLKTYNGSGGYWFTPLLYAFGNGSQSFETPALGSAASFYQARGGIGSDKISFFQGSIYYGEQGTEVADGGGTAGGNLYGGIISYFPTDPWNMSFAVDRNRNISDITSTTNLAQGGLGLVGAGISASESTQATAFTFRSNYQFSEQTLVFGVVSDTLIDFIGQPFVASSWLASMGIRHQLRQNLSLSFDYQYIRYISNQPLTSFTRNVVSFGAVYSF